MISKSYKKLVKYIESENYKGFDPYDTLNSFIPFKIFGKYISTIVIQLQKRNPINVRSFLGIKKEINPKAFGLFLQTYSMLYEKSKDQENLTKADYFFNWLINNHSKGYNGMSWGYNFPWASSSKYLNNFVPSAVVTGFVSKGIFQYYLATNNQKAIKILDEAKIFILNELDIYKDKSGICFSYTPIMQDICYNASLIAGEVLAMNYSINQDEDLKNKCIAIVNFVVSRQNKDGSWNYAEDIKTGEIDNQKDFHQGYIIDSIYEISKLINMNNEKWEKAIINGLNFYKNEQFFDEGRSLWRIPKEYPIEIHNQSQGIIIFSKFSKYDSSYLNFALKIAEYTINNMQSNVGYFYYQNFKNYKNKISYMRWNNAWMFLALTTLRKYNIE